MLTQGLLNITGIVARYVITNSSDWSISVGYIGAEFTFLYACIQVLVEAQTFTSGNTGLIIRILLWSDILHFTLCCSTHFAYQCKKPA